MAEDYITKMQNIRPVARINPDFSVSTVLMQSMDNYAYPTIFPIDPLNPSPSPEEWIELDGIEAFIEANRRDEVFVFNTDKEADKFAKGSWKKELKKKEATDIFSTMLQAAEPDKTLVNILQGD